MRRGNVRLQRLLASECCVDKWLKSGPLLRWQLAQLVEETGELGVKLFWIPGHDDIRVGALRVAPILCPL